MSIRHIRVNCSEIDEEARDVSMQNVVNCTKSSFYKYLFNLFFIQGGSSTHQEMCMAFVFYYPKIDFGLCTSVPSKTQTYPYFGIYNVT